MPNMTITRTSNHTFTCENCGEVHDAYMVDSYNVWSVGGESQTWCDSCAAEAHVCDHCGDLAEETTTVRVNNRYRCYATEEWCPDCERYSTTTCDCCGETCSDSFIEELHMWDGSYLNVCEDCRDDEYTTCDDCGRWVPRDDVEVVEDYWDCYDYCPNCIENHTRSENLHEYHHTCGEMFWFDDGVCKERWNLASDESKLLFLGLELETDYNDSAAELADDVAEHYDTRYCECKEDGSLHNNGLEIVSQPMTPLFHINSGMWGRIVEIVKRHGGSSHDAGTCGLHIHLSRDFFVNHDAVYRLDRIFHRFSKQLICFSRRTPSQLGQWCQLSEYDELAEIKDTPSRKVEWEDKKRWASRYEAVNDQNNATVEIRLWRGTLNMETLLATIEFTAGLAYVANTMSDELAEELTWPMLRMLVKYALEDKGIPHADLDAYLVRRGL